MSDVEDLLAALRDVATGTYRLVEKAQRLGLKVAVPVFVAVLRDENATVRFRSVTALGELKAEASSAVSVLLETLQQDEDEAVQARAQHLLAILSES